MRVESVLRLERVKSINRSVKKKRGGGIFIEYVRREGERGVRFLIKKAQRTVGQLPTTRVPTVDRLPPMAGNSRCWAKASWAQAEVGRRVGRSGKSDGHGPDRVGF